MAQLVFIDGRKMGSVVEIAGRLTIGRASDNQVPLQDKGVTDHHAEITSEGGRILIRRLDATARLAVNGHPAAEATLTHGDIITIGDITILFSDERPSKSSDLIGRDTPRFPASTATRVQSFITSAEAIQAFSAEKSLQVHFETLLRIGNDLSSTMDPQAIYDRLTQAIADVLQADRVFMIVRDELGNLRIAKELIRPEVRTKGHTRISRSILDEAIERKEAILTVNAMQDERFGLKQSIAQQNIHSAMCVPIQREKAVLGVLYADRLGSGRPYRAEDLKLLNGICAQAALALETVRRHRETLDYAAVLDRLAKASQSLSSLLEPEAVARTCVEDAARIFRSRRVTLMMLDEAAGVLRVAWSNCIPPNEWPHVRVPPGEGLSGQAIQRNQPLLKTDTQILERKGLRRYQTSSYLIAPVPAPHDDVRRHGRAIGVISLSDREGGAPFTQNDLQLLAIYASQIGITLSNARFFQRAITDALTRVHSREYFFLLTEQMIAAGNPLGVLMLDLDHFKAINDRYLHQRGDEVLAAIGGILSECVPPEGAAGRYGGEEFSVALPGPHASRATDVARTIHQRIGSRPIETSAGPIPVTVSIGVAFRRDGESAQDVVHRADQALYRAKNSGRNRIEIAD